MNESSFTSGLLVSLGFQQPKVISVLAQSSSSRGNLCLHHAKRSILQAKEDILKQGSPSSLQGQNTPALHRTSDRLEFDLQQGAEHTRPSSFRSATLPLRRYCGKDPRLGKGPWPTPRRREGEPALPQLAAPPRPPHSGGQPSVQTRPRALPRGSEARLTPAHPGSPAAPVQLRTRPAKRPRRLPRARAPPLTREGEVASLAQANILAGGVPGATIRCLCGERERVTGRRAGAAMGTDGAALPLTRCGCRTSEPTGWGNSAQARRGRRRAPGCSAAEEGGARRQGHFGPALWQRREAQPRGGSGDGAFAAVAGS